VKLETRDIDSIGIRLLAAIKLAFDGDGAAPLDRIGSTELAATIGADTSSPFSEWGKSGKPITPLQLSKMLKPFRIHPEQLPGGQARGYQRSWFVDAWERYLPSSARAVLTRHTRHKGPWMKDKLMISDPSQPTKL